MTLYLVRHPVPDIDPGICYGRLDVPAKNVAETAARLQQALPAGLPVWSSPLRRCRELAERLHPAPQFDDRLMEMDFGAWEGRPWSEIPRGEIDAWAADLMDYRGHGGESVTNLRQRLIDWQRDLPAADAVVVGHAGGMRVLLSDESVASGEPWFQRPFPFGEMVVFRPLS